MQSGQHVTPTIRLVRPLGQGAMGSVWVADHLALGTQVAVKFIAPAFAAQEELVARFRQEAMAAAQIRSPHVAQVFDHGVTPTGDPFIVMELLEGETLRDRLRRLGPRPVEEVTKLVGQTAKALSMAHRLGVVHRDVKPENLFVLDVGGEPFVKVIDFGIAKQTGAEAMRMTATSSFLGTPAYMSPEQLTSAKHVDLRADLWSLAVVAYEALTGKRPFPGESAGALIIALDAGSFPPPSSLRPGLPAAVDTWTARALHRDLAARFSSAREMADAFELATRSLTPAAGPESRREVESRPTPEPKPTPVPPRYTPAGGIEAVRPREPREAPVVLPPPGKDMELQVRGGRITLVKGRIVKPSTEAIVCPADVTLNPRFDALSDAIHRAAGPELAEMTSRLGPCARGGAVITGAGRFGAPTRFVIHAVGPVFHVAREDQCRRQLQGAILASLRLAEENGARSVAFPPVTTSFGYPIEKAAPLVLGAAVEHLARARAPLHVVFALLTQPSFEAFATALAELARSGA